MADDLYVETYPKYPSAVPMEHIDKTFEYNAPLFAAPPPIQRSLFQNDYNW